jgi:allantoinase
VIIKNGRVILSDQDNFSEFDIRIEKGQINEIGKSLSQGNGCAETEIIDAQGLFVLPGGIDPHVHFDDPGYTKREDFYHGSCAAASGGITTIIDMPCTSIPPVTNKRNLVKKLKAIESKAVVDYGLYGGISAQSFENDFPNNMEELSKYVLGFKTYFVSGMESFGRLNHYQFKRVLEKSLTLKVPILLHAEDFDYVQAATTISMREGNTPLDYYNSRPETAEALAALSAVEMARETGANLHIVHIGTSQVSQMLGGKITGETCPQYLEFDLTDFEKIGSNVKCTPPVKAPGNKEKLWNYLADGTIAFVASDHAPCSRAEKNTGSIWTDYAGMPGCGTLLPYVFSEGYMKRRITLRTLVKIISENAARRYGLFHRKGSIEVGKDADLVLIDPNQYTTVEGKNFYSKGKITPFEGRKFKGKVVQTILRGKVIYNSGQGIMVDGGYGKLLKNAA